MDGHCDDHFDAIARLLAPKGKAGRPKESAVEKQANVLAAWYLVENKLRDTDPRCLKKARTLAAALLEKHFNRPWRYTPAYLEKMHRAGARIMRDMPEVRSALLDNLSRYRTRPVFNRRGVRYLPK
jgi:hypothetical protein